MSRWRERADDSSGMALLVTLMVLVVLAVLVHRFTLATRVHLTAAANVRDQFQAECLAVSGLESAMAALRQDDTPEVDHVGELWATYQGSKDIPGLENVEGAFAVSIQDESGKIDVNRIVRLDGATTDEFVRGQIERLLDIFGVPSDKRDSLLDCLEDWIDLDDLNKLNGAENTYYKGLDSPYAARNGPLRTLGELNLVKGWSDILDLRLKDGSTFGDYLTVSPTGGKFNVNTASVVVLQTLSPEIDESIAGQVVSLREETPLAGAQLLPDPFRKKGVSGHLQYNSSMFLVRSEGYYRKALSKAEMLVTREQDQFTVVSRRIE
jgi:general secretion pathway protein K